MLYSGPERSICLATLNAAIICFGLRLSTRPDVLPAVQAMLRGDTCSLVWESLQLTAGTRPGKLADVEGV